MTVVTCLLLVIMGGIFALWRIQHTTILIAEVRAELARAEAHIVRQGADVRQILSNQTANTARFGGIVDRNTEEVRKAAEAVKKAHEDQLEP